MKILHLNGVELRFSRIKLALSPFSQIRANRINLMRWGLTINAQRKLIIFAFGSYGTKESTCDYGALNHVGLAFGKVGPLSLNWVFRRCLDGYFMEGHFRRHVHGSL